MTGSAAGTVLRGRFLSSVAIAAAVVAAGTLFSSTAGARAHHYHHGEFRRFANGAHVIQCVAFAKSDSGILIAGNARDWWSRAEGVYERGDRPEVGSVLAFRPVARMPLGHVAVVSAVLDRRTILIDQSHWGQAGIARDMQVIDVSDNNDWTAVRVELRGRSSYGSIYPVHGFIYPRPDDGEEANDRIRVQPRRVRALEVAEAPVTLPSGRQRLDLTIGGDTPSDPLASGRITTR